MNWTELIASLQADGLTQEEIAAQCGCGQSTISELLTGEIKNPRYQIGHVLISLHNSRLGHKSELSKKGRSIDSF